MESDNSGVDVVPSLPSTYREVIIFMFRHSGPWVSAVLLMCGVVIKLNLGWHLADVVLILSAFFLRGFLEWPFHLYIWHGHPLPFLRWRIRNPISAMHAKHHKFPHDADGLIFGGAGVAGVCALITVFMLILTGSPSFATTAVIAFLIVLFTHEWHHVIAHSAIGDVSPLFRRAVLCHRYHHHIDGRSCMGVSSVLADKLLGTYVTIEDVNDDAER